MLMEIFITGTFLAKVVIQWKQNNLQFSFYWNSRQFRHLLLALKSLGCLALSIRPSIHFQYPLLPDLWVSGSAGASVSCLRAMPSSMFIFFKRRWNNLDIFIRLLGQRSGVRQWSLANMLWCPLMTVDPAWWSGWPTCAKVSSLGVRWVKQGVSFSFLSTKSIYHICIIWLRWLENYSRRLWPRRVRLFALTRGMCPSKWIHPVTVPSSSYLLRFSTSLMKAAPWEPGQPKVRTNVTGDYNN